MSTGSSIHLTAQCSCGKVSIDVTSPPISHNACYCNDCQLGAKRIEALPGAAPLMDSDGGTPFLDYRKDRVRQGDPEQLLHPFKLKESSTTERFVSTCCNSAMYLSFQGGHWVSLYRKRFKGDVPPLERRLWTKYKRDDVTLPDDVPNHASYSLAFYGKLFVTWIAMMLRR